MGAVAAPASYWIWDNANTITIQPASGGARIVSATELETLNGANLGLLVSPAGLVEVIQHATATANINGTITLSRLLRGRRGTDDAGAFASAIYVLLDGTDLRFAGDLSALNAAEMFRVAGAFQTVQDAPAIPRTNTGRAERPYAPVHLVGSRDGSQNLTITWVRRTRLGGNCSICPATCRWVRRRRRMRWTSATQATPPRCGPSRRPRRPPATQRRSKPRTA